MEAKAKQDRRSGKGAGYAIIELTGADVPAGSDLAIALRRGDGQNLGSQGWQVAQERLQPDAVEVFEAGVRLYLGPQLVDHMEPQNYRLFVIADGRELPATLGWRNIAARSAGERGGGVRADIIERPETQAITRTETVAPVIIAPPPSEPDPAPALSPSPTPDTTATAEAVQRSTADLPAEPRKKGLAIAGGVAAVLVAAVAAYLLFARSSEPPADAHQPSAPSVAQQPAAQTPLAQARALLARNVDADTAGREAERLAQLTGGADAAFLLYEYAAEKGHAAAAHKLGGYFDPTVDIPGATIPKDPNLGYDHYQQALTRGVAGAADSARRLMSWAESQAALGNAEAAQLLKRRNR